LAVKAKFNSLEKPREICLIVEPFSPQNGVLTDTMKMKRNVAGKIFVKEIDEMYRLLTEREKAGK